jgi:UDP-N-acetylmuramate dehydrogenase
MLSSSEHSDASLSGLGTMGYREAFLARFGENFAKFDEPLAPYVAYRVGGPADVLVFPRNEADLRWIAEAAKAYRMPITVIGSGTNLLVVDRGIRGIVVSLLHAFREIEALQGPAGTVWVRCGGGVEKPELLEWAMARGLAGLEFSAGVPGTLGGGIFMNAGTKYGCYADILKELRLFDFTDGARTFPREALYFGYREQTAVGKGLVVSTVFELVPGNETAIRTEVARIIAERAEKQPLDFPSCGSTFKNPPGFSAGRLIEKSGLKGTVVGGAEISTKHANFILNKNGAKASDILALIDIIKERVKTLHQVELECEVIILGS